VFATTTPAKPRPTSPVVWGRVLYAVRLGMFVTQAWANASLGRSPATVSKRPTAQRVRAVQVFATKTPVKPRRTSPVAWGAAYIVLLGIFAIRF